MPRIYYGWYVVAALFVMLTVASGLAFYNLSVYMNALVAAHGFPVGVVSSATALFFVASGCGGLLAGRMISRFDPRWTIALGGVAGALALLALAGIRELWQLYLVYALFGVGHAMVSLVPATTLVTRWFDQKRSVALSVASTGLSVGGILLTPASAALISHLGLEGAMPRLAWLWFLGIVPLTLLVVRAGPPPVLDARGVAQEASGWQYPAAVRSGFFRLVTAAWVLAMLAQVGGIAHLFNLAATRVDTSVAATAVSLMASASIIGRFAGGWLLTRVDTRRFALVCLLAQSASMLVLALTMQRMGIFYGALLFGLTVGNLLMLQPLLLAEVYGARDYGRIFSLSQWLTTLGVAAGPLLIGVLYDLQGGYRLSFMVAACASLGGWLLVMLARVPAEQPEQQVGATPAAGSR
ncbi:MAG: MFS transporter [Gammaproteobacteria bacterium]|nr:MFS transporter [Gammaproteobacteria bacterium]